MSERPERLSSNLEGRLREGMQRDITDMVANRLVPHEAAVEELDAVIDGVVGRTDG